MFWKFERKGGGALPFATKSVQYQPSWHAGDHRSPLRIGCFAQRVGSEAAHTRRPLLFLKEKEAKELPFATKSRQYQPCCPVTCPGRTGAPGSSRPTDHISVKLTSAAHLIRGSAHPAALTRRCKRKYQQVLPGNNRSAGGLGRRWERPAETEPASNCFRSLPADEFRVPPPAPKRGDRGHTPGELW